MDQGNLRYAVLGIMSKQPDGLHCYQLAKECEALHDEFWEMNYGRVSRVLDSLERSGELTSKEELQSGRPNKKVYRITGQGHQTLDDWLLEPVSDTPRPLRDELALKLLFLDGSKRVSTLALIHQQRGIYVRKLARITRRRRRLTKMGLSTSVVDLVIEGAEMRVRADITWLDHVEASVRGQEPH